MISMESSMAENTRGNKNSIKAVTRATTLRKAASAKAVAGPEEGKGKKSRKNKKGKEAGGKRKVVRDFSMPQTEYDKLAKLKQDCISAGMRVKKNDLLRAGLLVLARLKMPQLKQALARLARG